MGVGYGLGQLIAILIYVAIWIVPFWRIFPRAGWNKWLSLLMWVPLLNLIMLWILAFKVWPMDSAQVEVFD